MSPLAALPTELHLHIGGHSSYNELLALCRTSKAMNQLYTEKLYEHVDLSRDPYGHRPISQYYEKQLILFQTLRLHPEYAHYVHALTWTPLDINIDAPGRNFWDNLVHQLMTASPPSAPSYLPAESGEIRKLLKMLVNVSRVQVSDLAINGRIRQQLHLENLSLFPKVTSISLIRSVSESTVKAILSGNKARQLQHLSFRNFFLPTTTSNLAVLLHSTVLFINSLIGKCTNLKSLAVVHGINTSLVSVDDRLGTTLLASYFALLKSVRGTLEMLHFEATGMEPFNGLELLRVCEGVQAVLKEGAWPCLRKAIILPEISIVTE